MEQEQFVGFDVSQAETSVCVVDGSGKVVWQGKCASTPEAMAATVQRRAPHAVRIALETGPMRVLLVNGALTTLTILGCAALTPSTPYAVIAIVLFASGLTRSLQFSALNSLAFADVPPEQTNATNTLANVVQQLTLGFGIAAAAAAVHLAALLHREAAVGPTLMDFRIAIVVAAIMTAISTLDALGLSQDAGSLVSGHRPLASKHENDLANSKA
jgi:hypothetical protein